MTRNCFSKFKLLATKQAYKAFWTLSSCGAQVTNSRLGIESLEERHRNAQSAFIVDLLNFRIDSPILRSKINLYAPSSTLRPSYLIAIEDPRTRFGHLDPFYRMCNEFNCVCALYEPGMSRNCFLRLMRHSRSFIMQ